MKKTWLLLNDTRIEGHLGCDLVVRRIMGELSGRGFEYIGSINQAHEFEPFQTAEPSLVVLNGEGTLHHGAQRANDLLRIACSYKKKGSKIVLINSVWEQNPKEFHDYLEEFDTVYFRESSSQKESGLGAKAQICPDLVLSYTSEELLPSLSHRVAYQCLRVRNFFAHKPVITDCVVKRGTDILASFSQKHHPHLFYMGGYGKVLTQDHIHALDIANLRLRHLLMGDVLITGRFHALCLALIFQKPFVVIASNTHKIQGTLNDLGLERVTVHSPNTVTVEDLEQGWREVEYQKNLFRGADFQGRMNEVVLTKDRMFDEITAL